MNEGRLLDTKRAFKQQRVWAIRFWLDQHRRLRDRALFDFAIDSKLRGCDGVNFRNTVMHSLQRTKASIIYKATGNLRAVHILPGNTDSPRPFVASQQRPFVQLLISAWTSRKRSVFF